MTTLRPDLILASASPRRRELLERMGLKPLVVSADLDESVAAGEDPQTYVARLATAKCQAVAARDDGTVEWARTLASLPILAADTTVVVDRDILGKPENDAEAELMLRRLAGRRHHVLTAYSILHGTATVNRTVSTTVAFRAIEPAEITAYAACGEWKGKAGGYAIQGIAAAFCTELRGSLTNVIGLPLAEVLADLRAVGALPAFPPPAFGIRA